MATRTNRTTKIFPGPKPDLKTEPRRAPIFSRRTPKAITKGLTLEEKMRAESSENLSGVLNQKTVVLVGPASYLKDENIDKWIDSHDIVVRMNYSRAQEGYGTRTDILFQFCTNLGRHYFYQTPFAEDGVSYIYITHFFHSWLNKYLNVLSKDIKVCVMPPKEFDQFKTDLRTAPLQGALAIREILKHDIKSLDVVGMDLYLTGYCENYKSEERDFGFHDFDLHALWIEKVHKEDSRLNLDFAMKKRIEQAYVFEDDGIFDGEVSFLIPFRTDNGYRAKLMDWTIKRLQTICPNCEIVVGENYDERFNRAKALNDAARRATFDLMCILDNDVVFNTDAIHRAYNYYQETGLPVQSRNKIYDLDEETTNDLLNENYPIKKKIGFLGNRGCFPFLFVSQEQYWSVGGHDESFCGWGGEDTAFKHALKLWYGPAYGVIAKILHLYHPISPARKEFRGSKYDKRQKEYLKTKTKEQFEAVRNSPL